MLTVTSARAACNFRAPLSNQLPLGAISPIQAGSVVGSITLRIMCTQNNSPAFSITGSNDTGPGLHRMRNLNQPTKYLPYRVMTSMPNRTRLLMTITITQADYQNAWVGPYEDTLYVTVTP
jgi:spore coat protein U-like protein